MVSGIFVFSAWREQKRCGADIRESDDRFLVTGLWHGAGMTFVLWGVYYGVLQVIERLGFKKNSGKIPGDWMELYVSGSTVWMGFIPGGHVCTGRRNDGPHDLSVEVFTDRCTFYKIL